MSDRINCRNCIHFNDLEHRCCLNDGNEIKKECYFTLSKRKPKGKDIVIENLKTKISDLEAKLAEKEKEIKMLKLDLGMFKSVNEFLNGYGIEKAREVLLQTEKTKNQDKIEFAIAELEKVNGTLTDTIIEVTQDEFDLNKLCYLEEISAKFCEKIDKQIKELKEGK